VVVIDDVVTHADSKLEALRTLEANGLVAHDVVVLVDREQGGPEAIAAAGYRLHAAVKISELLAYWRETGGIAQGVYQRVMDYFAAAKAQ
jgi:orotate phosphoribosyltransferase